MSRQQTLDHTWKLTPKQSRFCAEYLIDLNGTQAAIRAGYSADTAQKNAYRLMANEGIKREIRRLQTASLDALGLDADRIKLEIARLALVDIRGFYDEQGNLKRMNELTPEQGAALAGVETMIRNVEAGDGRRDVTYKIRLWDKLKALEILAKHFGLLVDRVEIDVNVNHVIHERLKAARARLAERRALPDVPATAEAE